MKEEKLVMISEYDSSTEAEMAKSLLESAGIESVIGDEYMSTVYPAGIPARLFVGEDDAAAAREMIEA